MKLDSCDEEKNNSSIRDKIAICSHYGNGIKINRNQTRNHETKKAYHSVGADSITVGFLHHACNDVNQSHLLNQGEKM